LAIMSLEIGPGLDCFTNGILTPTIFFEIFEIYSLMPKLSIFKLQ